MAVAPSRIRTSAARAASSTSIAFFVLRSIVMSVRTVVGW
jgi:hypothetical protein